MITQEQYKHAGKMLSLLDMNANEVLYHKYLDIALDYESDNGYFCNDFILNNSLISQHQTLMPRRSSGTIILIVEPVLQVNQ